VSPGPAGAPTDAAPGWQVRDRRLPLDRPIIFGILNVTPDSFSDGGSFLSADAALTHARRMADEGADVIDVGGESTRPQGATEVTAGEELRRVLPVIRGIVRALPGVVVSLDTVKADVADAGLSEGAHAVNDVSGFRLDERMGAVCARHGAGVVLMHSRGTVRDMATYANAQYTDVVAEVLAELTLRVGDALAAGVADDAIAVDPGIGFSKRSGHSLALLAAMPRLAAWGYPVLVGASRKRVVGDVTGVSNPGAREFGTLGVHVAALCGGARMFRVHDVASSRQALDAAWAVIRGTAWALSGPHGSPA
jgi:dihydropteroate synthase